MFSVSSWLDAKSAGGLRMCWLVLNGVALYLQAASDLDGNVRQVAALMQHPAFDITQPPACEHLLLGFADSVPNFHAEDGSGYTFMADAVLKVMAC